MKLKVVKKINVNMKSFITVVNREMKYIRLCTFMSNLGLIVINDWS